MLTTERLKELLRYDPETGEFVWLVRKNNNRVSAGTVAGFVITIGYRQIQIDGHPYYAHRLAWFYAHGIWPADQIDHINRVRLDNRLCNLRQATNQENQYNLPMFKTNTSGYTGVTWNKAQKKWRAQISHKGKVFSLGDYSEIEQAIAARQAGERKHRPAQGAAL